MVSFYISFCLFMWKILEDSKIRTRIVRVEGKDTDHKTTTTVLNSVLFIILSILAGVAVGAAGEVYKSVFHHFNTTSSQWSSISYRWQYWSRMTASYVFRYLKIAFIKERLP